MELEVKDSPLTLLIPKGELTVPEYRQWITDMEAKMVAYPEAVDRHNQETLGFGLKNTFTPGLYTRELFMPKGALVISRIHLFEHPFIISQGEVSVYDGTKLVHIKAPYQGVTPAGTKRILYVHEDTIWTTFHVTDKQTMEDVDVNGVITCDTFDEFESIIHKEITL